MTTLALGLRFSWLNLAPLHPRKVGIYQVRAGRDTRGSAGAAKRWDAKRRVIRPPNVLGVSCAAGPARRSRSGAAVAAHDIRRTESRPATAVTPSRWRKGRQLGCRSEAGPQQLHTKVRPRCDLSLTMPISTLRLVADLRRYGCQHDRALRLSDRHSCAAPLPCGVVATMISRDL